MYKEKDGILYKLDFDGCTGGRLRWVRSRRKTYKDTWRYRLWYHMPAIIQAGYQVVFAICAVAAVIMTGTTFWAMWNALI